MFSNINKLAIIVDFKINQATIAKELCENIDKPEMHCDGKCYLAKQIKAQEKKEQELPFPLQKEKVELIYYNDFSALQSSILPDFCAEKKYQNRAVTINSQEFLQSIFRPPILS